MNVEALKLVLEHSYKLPVENYCNDDWASNICNDYTPGKNSRKFLLFNKVKFDIIGWSCMFKSMTKLGLRLDLQGLPKLFDHDSNMFIGVGGWEDLYEFFSLSASEWQNIFECSEVLSEIQTNLKNAIELYEVDND